MKIRYVSLIVAVFFMFIVAFAAQLEGRTCGNINVNFIQITLGELDAGIYCYETFRLSDNGTLQRAIWDSEKILYEVAKPINIGVDKYISVKHLLKKREKGGLGNSQQGYTTIGPPAFILNLAWLTPEGVYFSTLGEMSINIRDLLDEWRIITPGNQPPPGNYLWTTPYPKIDPVDVEIDSKSSPSPVALTLLNALRSGNLIEPAAENLNIYLTGENKYRYQFGATFFSGFIGFGVITAQSKQQGSCRIIHDNKGRVN